ncbi:VOC family protein [Nocardia otitidiscaviarum]|uniref:VOC family protein n=1 Tax=Nocardia otitidiscaviarum TaxID=1823 RepID=UPI0004A6D3DD|nr:VOC family protein [Nocardia otitidiscaviarum]MBF6135202.1 VOC family protein [Nocardia otitidiscaviarum]MBF6181165.1 VOC family protein [Nocardia otitidiscaviarum]MBF6487023.1 VOC family protein [Nocardia otitidiscaviarum]
MGNPVVHWEIGGPDGAALQEFYGKAFGWTIHESGPDTPDYRLIDGIDGRLGGGIWQTSAEVPPYVTVYIEVPDLAAKLEEIQRLGATVTVPPTPIGDSMSMAMFTDPGGATVGLLQYTTGGA